MDINSINQFNLKICPLSISSLVNHIDHSIKTKAQPMIISGVNAYAVVLSKHNSIYRNYLMRSSIVNIDGYSIVFALRFLGYRIQERASCPDLFYDLVKLADNSNYSIYLLGSDSDTVQSAAKNLKNKYPSLQIVGVRSGYFHKEEEQLIAQDLIAKKPTMLFLAMPSPMKESFAFKYAEELNIPVTLGVGGLFDVVAGKVKRAPVWMQNLGMEWFYRFIQEPRRLWRRYLVDNIKFVFLVLKEKIKTSNTYNTPQVE